MRAIEEQRVFTKKQGNQYLLIAIGVTALMYLPSLSWSFGHDQNVFAELGSLILKGKLPYVEAWEIKPPNIFYVYAFAEWIFGQSELAIRLFDFASVVVTSALIFLFVRKNSSSDQLTANRTALIASFLFVTVELTLGLADTAQTESFALPWIIGAMLLSYRSESPLKTLLAGAMIAVAGFFKTTNFVFAVPLVIEILSRRDARIKAFLAFCFGCLLFSGAELLFMFSQGYLAEYLKITRSVLLEHSSEMAGTPVTIFSVLRIVWVYVGAWVIVAVAGIAALAMRSTHTSLQLRYRSSIRFLLFSGGVLLSGVIAVLAQRKGWGYHYVVLLPGLLPLVAGLSYPIVARMAHAVAKIGLPIKPPAIGLALVVLITIIPLSGAHLLHAYYDSYLAITNRPHYMSRLGAEQSMYYPVATNALAGYLAQHSKPDAKIFILGQEPGAYWKANRMPATRYFYTLLFTSPVMATENFAELNQALINKPPQLIVIERFDTLAFSGQPITSEGMLHSEKFATLDSLLGARYAFSDVVANKFLIYALKP